MRLLAPGSNCANYCGRAHVSVAKAEDREAITGYTVPPEARRPAPFGGHRVHRIAEEIDARDKAVQQIRPQDGVIAEAKELAGDVLQNPGHLRIGQRLIDAEARDVG